MDTIASVMITLHIDEQPALFLTVGEEGSIHRMGTGSVTSDEKDMFIGVTDPSVFTKIKSALHPAWFDKPGLYSAPEKKGALCKLLLAIRTHGGDERALQFEYGAESTGPPPVVRDLVATAIQASDPWYDGQKRMVEGTEDE